MSLSSKSSRRNSLSSLFNLGGNSADNDQIDRLANDHAHNQASGSQEECTPPGTSGRRQHDYRDDDDNSEPPRYLTYAQNHPMGRLFLALFRENAKNAKKDLDISIDELCGDFYRAMQLEKDNTHRTVQQAARGIEQEFVNRDLNAHTINMSFPPPTNFSRHPIFTSLQHRADCIRQFPTRPKFGGAGKEGTMDIIEFLNAVNSAQANCKLSESEFKEMLLACTTGRPHALLMEWIANTDDIATIYHNLLLHFDKRISPEAARQQLYAYKAPKTTTLAGAEAHIMALASRACSTIPIGPTRTATYNLESIQALIRCLPRLSSDMVLTKFNELTARQRHAPTAAELSRMLYSFRHVIDQDIKSNGADKSHSSPQKGKIRNKNAKYTSSYAVAQVEADIDYEYDHSPRKSRGKRHENDTHGGSYNVQGDRSPTPFHKNPRDRKERHTPERSKSGRFVAKHGDKSKQPQRGQKKFCTLCGQNNHTMVQGCRNMVNNEGKIVSVMPTMGTCPACPSKIKTRLNHPSSLCPFRKGAPLEHA